jgi:hypothetical protein
VRKGIRWVVTVLVVKLPMKKAVVSTQNTSVPAAWRSVRLPGEVPARAPAGVGDGRGGGARKTSACTGTVSTPSSAARTTRAVRQPRRSTSHASMGMKMVLARAPASVTTRSARSRSPAGNQPTTAANAGS